MKFCRNCSKNNEEVEFVRNRRWCVTCYEAYCKEYDKNKKKKCDKGNVKNQKKLCNKKHLENNIDKKKCRVCGFVGENDKFIKLENICKVCNKEYSKKYHESHKEKAKVYMKRYTETHKDEIFKQQKEYYKNNIPKYLYKLSKGRARIKNIEFTITIKDIENIMPFNNICIMLNIQMQYNDNKVAYNSFTLDRIDNTKGYIRGNINVICHRANVSKNDTTLFEYSEIVNNFKNVINNKNIILKNGGNFNINLKSNFHNLIKTTKIYNLPKSNITLNFLNRIYPKDSCCILCGNKMIKGKGNPCKSSPSLDKIIPKLGYQENNTMWVCRRCNVIKSDLSLSEMELLLKNWKAIL